MPQINLRNSLKHLFESCLSEASNKSVSDLLKLSDQHLESTKEEKKVNAMVNLALATEIHRVLGILLTEAHSEENLKHIKAAAYYFAKTDDDEDDFSSPLGFEDDAEILNAVSEFLGHNDLIIKIEDFDHA